MMLGGCGGWYNPENPYAKPGSNGTPSERTGGTLPPNEHKPLYPGWSASLMQQHQQSS
jgi:hypothetical protein